MDSLIGRIRAERHEIEPVEPFDRPREDQIPVRRNFGEIQIANRLVKVVPALEVRALRAYIADLQGLPAAEVALDSEVPRLEVRRWRVRVEAVHVLDPSTPSAGPTRGERVLQGRRGHAPVASRIERLVEREREHSSELAANRSQQVSLVEETVSAADHVPVVSERPPSEAQPRRDVVVVRIDQATPHADLACEDGAILQAPLGKHRVEVRKGLVAGDDHLVQSRMVRREPVVHVEWRKLHLVPHAEVQREVPRHLPVVVEEHSEACRAQFAERGLGAAIHVLQPPQEQVPDGVSGESSSDPERTADVIELRLVVTRPRGVDSSLDGVRLPDPRQLARDLEIADILPAGGVGALAEGEVPHDGHPGQSPQIGIQVFRHGQSDRGWVEVGGDRIGVEGAPAEATRQFEDQRRRERARVADRDQVATVANLVSPNRQSAARERILQVVEPPLVACREGVLGREALIELEHDLVPVVIVLRHRDVVEADTVPVRRGVVVDQALRDRIDSRGGHHVVREASALDAAVAGARPVGIVEVERLRLAGRIGALHVERLRQVSGPLQIRGDVAEPGASDRLDAPFVARQEEAPIAPDRSADRAAVLVASQAQPFLVEEPPCVDRLVAYVLEQRAMDLIGPGSHRQADDASGKAAVFRRESRRHDPELFHGVQRRAHLRSTSHRISVADAVHVEVGLISAGAVDRGERALPGSARHHARHEEGEVGEIATRKR